MNGPTDIHPSPAQHFKTFICVIRASYIYVTKVSIYHLVFQFCVHVAKYHNELSNNFKWFCTTVKAEVVMSVSTDVLEIN